MKLGVEPEHRRIVQKCVFILDEFPIYAYLAKLNQQFEIPEGTEVTLFLSPKEKEVVEYLLGSKKVPNSTDVIRDVKASPSTAFETYRRYWARLHLPPPTQLYLLRTIERNQETHQLIKSGVPSKEISVRLRRSRSTIAYNRKKLGLSEFRRPKEEVHAMNLKIRVLDAIGLPRDIIREIMTRDYPDHATRLKYSSRMKKLVDYALKPDLRRERREVVETDSLPRAAQIITLDIPTEYMPRLKQIDPADPDELTRLTQCVNIIQQILNRAPDAEVRNRLLEFGIPEGYVDRLIAIREKRLDATTTSETYCRIKRTMEILLGPRGKGIYLLLRGGHLFDFEANDKVSPFIQRNFNSILNALVGGKSHHLFITNHPIEGQDILFIKNFTNIQAEDHGNIPEFTRRLGQYITRQYAKAQEPIPHGITAEDMASRFVEEALQTPI